VSGMVNVEYGVRQGSLLGPVLYLLHVSDLPLALEIRDSDGDSIYADDTAVWVVAKDHEEAPQELQRLVHVVVAYMRANGLALNGAKTQVMVGGKGKPPPLPPSPSTSKAQRSSPGAPLTSWESPLTGTSRSSHTSTPWRGSRAYKPAV
jgi:hypothetical protein